MQIVCAVLGKGGGVGEGGDCKGGGDGGSQPCAYLQAFNCAAAGAARAGTLRPSSINA